MARNCVVDQEKEKTDVIYNPAHPPVFKGIQLSEPGAYQRGAVIAAGASSGITGVSGILNEDITVESDPVVAQAMVHGVAWRDKLSCKLSDKTITPSDPEWASLEEKLQDFGIYLQ